MFNKQLQQKSVRHSEVYKVSKNLDRLRYPGRFSRRHFGPLEYPLILANLFAGNRRATLSLTGLAFMMIELLRVMLIRADTSGDIDGFGKFLR